MRRVLWGLLLLPICGFGLPLRYEARMDEADWRLRRVGAECRLTQTIPHFGEVRFAASKGEPLRFEMRSARRLPPTALVALSLEPALWRHDHEPQALGDVRLQEGGVPVRLSGLLPDRLLQGLERGYQPRLRFGRSTEALALDVSPVSFQPALERFLACRADLLRPVAKPRPKTVVASADAAGGTPAGEAAGSGEKGGAAAAPVVAKPLPPSAHPGAATAAKAKPEPDCVCEDGKTAQAKPGETSLLPPPSVKSASQDALKMREQRLQSGKGSGGSGGSYVGSMHFLPGQAGIDKKGQDEMELFLRNWQAEGGKVPVTLAVEASEAERSQMEGHLEQAKRYLITRGIPANLVKTQVQARPVTGGGRLSMQFEKAAKPAAAEEAKPSHGAGAQKPPGGSPPDKHAPKPAAPAKPAAGTQAKPSFIELPPIPKADKDAGASAHPAPAGH